jgi:sialic acid synthase SpsE
MLREIGGRRIGGGAATFVIAEIGLNHGGSVDRALQMVEAAAWAGASAVKLQTLFADRLVAPWCPAPAHVTASSLADLFAGFQLDADAHRAIVSRARQHKLAVMSTPFTEDAIPMLEALDLDAYKIASGDLTNDGLIAAVAKTGRPLVVSTGMSTLAEVERAVGVARANGAIQIGVLHCVSVYPTPPEAQNLRAIATLADALGVPVGLSDHGPDTGAAPLAVALGASLYERHLVLPGDEGAIDRDVSSTPVELKEAIASMLAAQTRLGSGRKVCQPAELQNLVPSRRGLYARRPLSAGSRIAVDDVVALRPATTLSPAEVPMLVGSVLTRDVAAGDPFSINDILLARAS